MVFAFSSKNSLWFTIHFHINLDSFGCSMMTGWSLTFRICRYLFYEQSTLKWDICTCSYNTETPSILEFTQIYIAVLVMFYPGFPTLRKRDRVAWKQACASNWFVCPRRRWIRAHTWLTDLIQFQFSPDIATTSSWSTGPLQPVISLSILWRILAIIRQSLTIVL